jgi:hypothetical protein
MYPFLNSDIYPVENDNNIQVQGRKHVLAWLGGGFTDGGL